MTYGQIGDFGDKRCIGYVWRPTYGSGRLTVVRVGNLVATGRTSDVYEFGRNSVVKVPRPNVPRHWSAKEAGLTAAVRELGVLAPLVVDVVEIDGRESIVFERVHGRSMWELIQDQPRQAGRWGRELAAVHRQILWAGLPRNMVGIVERMQSKLDSASRLSPDDREMAHRVLDSLPRGAALLHGDLHPGNVLVGEAGLYVIDWFDAAVGHPAADVVRSSILTRPLRGFATRPHLPQAEPVALGEFHNSYVRAIGDVLQRSRAQLSQWEAVVAASRLAEGAEADETVLLDVWRGYQAGGETMLVSLLPINQASQNQPDDEVDQRPG